MLKTLSFEVKNKTDFLRCMGELYERLLCLLADTGWESLPMAYDRVGEHAFSLRETGSDTGVLVVCFTFTDNKGGDGETFLVDEMSVYN